MSKNAPIHYWLFKAEPDVYGISHLAKAPNKIGRWDGIRNYQARNFLRDQVKVNDEVFIYHSGIKNPAIVGTATIVKAAYPDPLQFDPQSDYFDAKASIDNPRWVSVDIKLKEVFSHEIYLTAIKQQSALGDMALLRQPRLSIQPVTHAEWTTIMHMHNHP